jgi:N-acetylneuraminate synthase
MKTNEMNRPFIIAEIGINHNGDLEVAKKLIDVASFAGCDAVKFQKRTVEDVYTKEELDKPRESPWGTTNREQKLGLEFSEGQFDEIDSYCRNKGIQWFASAWDLKSQHFLRKYDLNFNKVASAMLTVRPLLDSIIEEKKYTFISTGMSTIGEIDRTVELFLKGGCKFELMHTNSSYPMKDEDANLRMIETLRNRYQCKVGYSGHEVGLQISLAAIAMGASSLERHITLDRSMYGSDQAASVEPTGLMKLVRDARIIYGSLGSGEKVVTDKEKQIKEKLRPAQWR